MTWPSEQWGRLADILARDLREGSVIAGIQLNRGRADYPLTDAARV
jgi:hypothetical protein